MLVKKVLLSICAILLISGSSLFAQNDYIGAAKCKMCHNKADKGDQYKKWAESAHANAFKNLAGAKAMEVAKAKGIANPQKDQKCTKCHTTPTLAAEEGVSCEACHGAGSAYKSPAVMKNREQAIKNGLIVPNAKTCTKCHNSESPTFKGFDFTAMSKKIAHMMPK